MRPDLHRRVTLVMEEPADSSQIFGGRLFGSQVRVRPAVPPVRSTPAWTTHSIVGGGGRLELGVDVYDGGDSAGGRPAPSPGDSAFEPVARPASLLPLRPWLSQAADVLGTRRATTNLGQPACGDTELHHAAQGELSRPAAMDASMDASIDASMDGRKRRRSASASSSSSDMAGIMGSRCPPSPEFDRAHTTKFHRRESSPQRDLQLLCTLPPTCSQPGKAQAFATQAALDAHQASMHRWVCRVPIKDKPDRVGEGELVLVPEHFSGRSTAGHGRNWRECGKVFPDERLLDLVSCSCRNAS